MSLDSKQLALAASDLKRIVLEEIAGDQAAPAHTAAVARLLMEKPWVPDFLMPLISPLRSAMRSYLKMSVVRVEARVWYFPSFHWWRNHARSLHGEDGSGCDVSAHVAALTEGSPDAIFKAGDLMKDGSVRVLGAPDFAAEALNWDKYYRLIGTR